MAMPSATGIFSPSEHTTTDIFWRTERVVDGRVLKMLCVIDEHTRQCLAIEVGASLRSQDVILVLSRLMRLYGKPIFIRSDNGAEFTAAKVAGFRHYRRATHCLIGYKIPPQVTPTAEGHLMRNKFMQSDACAASPVPKAQAA